VAFDQNDSFSKELNSTLEEHGVAVVTGILNPAECEEFQQLMERELTEDSAQPRRNELPKEWWANAWVHAQGELLWRSRCHPRVRETFERIFGMKELACGLDLRQNFYTPKGTPHSVDNLQWLHVDQNTLTGMKDVCYQGVLYVWSSDGEDKSTTVVWAGSHKDDGVYGQLIDNEYAVERGKEMDDSGVHCGHCIQLDDRVGEGARTLENAAVVGSRRVPVPAGALLLWNSKTIHQGWTGGPRLAVPVCWEPRDRVTAEARQRKLFMAAAGLPSSHSPSEGRLHPCVSSRRGEQVRLSRPVVRPYSVLGAHELSSAEWEKLWASWQGEQHVEQLASAWESAALEKVLKPEIAAVL